MEFIIIVLMSYILIFFIVFMFMRFYTLMLDDIRKTLANYEDKIARLGDIVDQISDDVYNYGYDYNDVASDYDANHNGVFEEDSEEYVEDDEDIEE